MISKWSLPGPHLYPTSQQRMFSERLMNLRLRHQPRPKGERELRPLHLHVNPLEALERERQPRPLHRPTPLFLEPELWPRRFRRPVRPVLEHAILPHHFKHFRHRRDLLMSDGLDRREH